MTKTIRDTLNILCDAGGVEDIFIDDHNTIFFNVHDRRNARWPCSLVIRRQRINVYLANPFMFSIEWLYGDSYTVDTFELWLRKAIG